MASPVATTDLSPRNNLPLNPTAELKKNCETVEKIGRLYRTHKITKTSFMGLTIAFSSLAAATFCFTGLIPIANVVTISVVLVAGGVGLIFMALLVGVPKTTFRGAKFKQQESEREYQKQVVGLLIQLKGQIPIEGDIADRVLKKCGTLLEKIKIDCSTQIFKKGWKRAEVQGFINTISKYFSHLKVLELEGATRIRNINLECLKELKKLETLVISKSDITDAQLIVLAPLKKVTRLFLIDCPRLTRKSLEALKKWTLKELNLNGTPLQGLSLQHARVFITRMKLKISQFIKERDKKDPIRIKNKPDYRITAKTSQKERNQILIEQSIALRNAPERCRTAASIRRYYLFEREAKTRKWLQVMKAADAECLTQFKKLEQLTLSHVEDDVLKHVAHLKKLRSLEITHSLKFTGAGFAHLKPLNQMTHLTLGTCSALDPDSLAYLDRNHFRKIREVRFDWDVIKYGDVQDKDRWECALKDMRRRFNLQKNKSNKIADLIKYNRLKGNWSGAGLTLEKV